MYRPRYMRSRVRESGALALSKRALAAALAARKQLNVEYKRYDIAIDQFITDVAFGVDIILLDVIAEGTGYNQRIGRSARFVSSYLNVSVALVFPSVGVGSSVRLMVIRDKASNGVMPTYDEIVANTTGDWGSTVPMNPDNAGNRFEIVSSEKFEVYAGGKQACIVDVYRNMRDGAHVSWSGTGGTISNCVSGHLFLFMTCSTQGTDQASQVRLDGYHRTVYVDN